MTKRLLVINQPQVSELIRDLRQEIGLTQEKFAALLGVTWLTVNRWENGRTQPSPLAIKQVTVHGGSKKMSDMKSDGISTKTGLDLIFFGYF